MKVTVKLFAILKKDRGNSSQAVPLEDGAPVRDLLECLGLHENDVGILMVNSRSATFDQTLCNGDIVTIIPSIGGG